MNEFIIFLLMVALGVAAYKFGYTIAQNKWQEIAEEHISDLVEVEIEKIRALYDETYRNVFRHAVQILKEEISANEEN